MTVSGPSSRMGRQISHTNPSCSGPRASPSKIRKTGFLFVFYVLSSTLFQLPPLRFPSFHCVRGCWDRIQDDGIEPKRCWDRTPRCWDGTQRMLGWNPRMLGSKQDAGIEPKDAWIEPKRLTSQTNAECSGSRVSPSNRYTDSQLIPRQLIF